MEGASKESILLFDWIACVDYCMDYKDSKEMDKEEKEWSLLKQRQL